MNPSETPGLSISHDIRGTKYLGMKLAVSVQLANINRSLENAEVLMHGLIPILQTFRSTPHDQRDSQLLNSTHTSGPKPSQTFISKRRQKEHKTYICLEENPPIDMLPRNQTNERVIGSNSHTQEWRTDASDFSVLSYPRKRNYIPALPFLTSPH